MSRHDDLEREFDAIINDPKPETFQTGQGILDMRVNRVLALLGKAVVRLDRTSGRLAMVNIALTITLAVIGVIQIVLMVKGH